MATRQSAPGPRERREEVVSQSMWRVAGGEAEVEIQAGGEGGSRSRDPEIMNDI